MANETLADELLTMIKSETVNNPAPQKCRITKVYEDMHVDVESLTGLLKYVQVFGTNVKTGDEGVLLFLNETYEDYVVLSGNGSSGVVVDTEMSSTSTNAVQNKVIQSALNGKASSSHSHSISDVSSLQSSLDGKSDTGHTHTKSNITDFAHTHDDRYYTETETDNLLSGKASSSHSHSKSDITDFPSIPSASSTTPSADTSNGSVGTGSTYARSNHTHPKSSLYAEASHTHTISNVTDLQSSLDGKANTSHTHTKSQITDFPNIPSKTSDLTNDGDGSNVFVKDNDSRLSDARTPTSHTHGVLTNDGKITTSYVEKDTNDFPVVADNSDGKKLKRGQIYTGFVWDNYARPNIGTSAQATQTVINNAIDTKIRELENLISDNTIIETYHNYSEEMSLTRTSSNVTKVVDNGLSFKNLDKWKMSFELKSDSYGARLDVKNINNLGDFKNYIGFGLDSGGYLKVWWATGNGTESGVTFGQPMSLNTYYPMVIERKGDYIRFNWNNNVFYTLSPQYFNTIEDLSLQLTKYNVNGTMYAKNIFIEVIEGIK